jgi:hypothetical protein
MPSLNWRIDPLPSLATGRFRAVQFSFAQPMVGPKALAASPCLPNLESKNTVDRCPSPKTKSNTSCLTSSRQAWRETMDRHAANRGLACAIKHWRDNTLGIERNQ